MELSGSYVFNAPADRVWAALMDPAVLSKCLPGVESLEAVAEAEYSATLRVGVGPIRGRYNARIWLKDLQPHSSYSLALEGTGSLGFASGSAQIALTEQAGDTTVNIQGEAQVGGTIARVGQRMMGSVAQGMLDRFIACVRESV